jgi:hypothetical protein
VLRDLLADAPDCLGRDVDVESVAHPVARRLVRLECVVQQRRGAVLGLDDRVGVGESALEVAALVGAWLTDERTAPHRFLGIEQRLEDVPLHVDQRERRPRPGLRLGRDRSDGLALVARLLGEDVGVARADRRTHAGGDPGAIQVEAPDACARVRASKDGRVQHAGEHHVGGVERLPARSLQAVHAAGGLSDDRESPGGPGAERVLLDDDPLLGVAALDLLLGLDQSRHVAIASSILG